MAKIETKLPVKTEKREPAAREDMWSPLESLRREIDKLFETFRPAAWSVPFSRSLLGFEMPSLTGKEWQIAPAVDLVEKDTEYEISAELPGLEEKNIEVKLSNGTLTIKGEKKEEKEEREKDYYLSERRFGSFQRRFQLPHGVDPDEIEATFTKGVLKLKLPKTPEAQKSEKKIAVRAV
ncbi:Hsp20/alpha crystallin family protein [Sinorhizobium fredii]|uniref:Hsp20/alpha crystallin family protein n=1 Tax=Rhizobium fredii TaxID=380 RepID=UPI003516F4C5